MSTKVIFEDLTYMNWAVESWFELHFLLEIKLVHLSIIIKAMMKTLLQNNKNTVSAAIENDSPSMYMTDEDPQKNNMCL